MEKKYMKIDLHVHTPASCDYNGKGDDCEFLKILQCAKEKNLNAIAVTDHNTLAGFERFCQIKQDLESKLSVFDQFNFEDNPLYLAQKQEIISNLDLFNSITIYLGAEITVNPGIHVIVIGNANDTVFFNSLLEKLGYSDEKRGSDDVITQKDIFQFLNMPELHDRIVFAPHIDSNKGIYNDIKKGTFRSHIFTSDNLNLVSVNSSTTRAKIQDMLKQPEYKRSRPLGFINASDSHSCDDVGAKVSYFLMESCTFENLIYAVRNPDTNVSNLPNPRVIDSVKRILDNRVSLVADPNIKSISECLCACLNEKYGYIILGYDLQCNELNGVKENKAQIEQLFTSATEMLVSRSKTKHIDLKTYKHGSGSFVHIAMINCVGNNIWSVKSDSVVYKASKDHRIKAADILEIEDLAQSNLLDEFKKAEKRQESHFKHIFNELDLLKKPISKSLICQSIALKSITLSLLKQPLYLPVEMLNPKKTNF